MQNGFVESFNGRLRDECLNETLFTSLAEARFMVPAWQQDYNKGRPSLRFGGKTLTETTDTQPYSQNKTGRFCKTEPPRPKKGLVRATVEFRRSLACRRHR
jgi:hypothetical protein